MSYSTITTAPLLSAAEEVGLAQTIERGRDAASRIEAGRSHPEDQAAAAAGARARKRFIEANLRLVLSVASKTRIPASVDREDVIQDGMLGLDRAVTKFDWRRGYKFSTYATWWIKQSIQVGLERSSSVVPIPARTAAELRAARAADEALASERVIAADRMTRIDSLDRKLSDADSARLGDLIACETAGPDETVESLGDQAGVRALVDTLDEVSAQVVIARFGLDGREPETLATIAERLDMSAEAVRRRLARAFKTMRPNAARLTAPTPAAYVALAA